MYFSKAYIYVAPTVNVLISQNDANETTHV